MRIEQNKSLQAYNSFGISVSSRYFTEVNNLDDFRSLATTSIYKKEKKLILGGGSNILFTSDFDGLVIKNNLKGITVVKEDAYHVWIKASAGEEWHPFVLFCVEGNLAGVENLSLIPGLVGAAPIQNIGAYGMELSETCEEVEAIELDSGEKVVIRNRECEFGYRNSVFKNRLKDKVLITSVTMKVNKVFRPRISYGDIRRTLEEMRANDITIKAVSDAVIKIRTSKLPDPREIGNAGSFFKNPIITADKYEALTANYPLMPMYPERNGKAKIPAGWLIEQCGWKGKRIGATGVHPRQALVLVNYGGATGSEIHALAMRVQESVKEKFDIDLMPEVNII